MEKQPLTQIRAVLQKQLDELLLAKIGLFENKQTPFNEEEKNRLAALSERITAIRTQINDIEILG